MFCGTKIGQLRYGVSKCREEATAEIVRNLLKNGMPVEQLSLITGLSVEKIRCFG
jgi:hypothetical protein